jgi:hypothetical protein
MKDSFPPRFTEELRRWARRPPSRPAPLAWNRILARLEARPPARLWMLAAATLAVILALPRPSREREPAAGRPQSLIVFQLQSGTKLYFALPPEGAPKGDRR